MFIVCAAVVGCSGAPSDDGVLQLALETSPTRLDPATVVDVAGGQVCSMVFQGLVRFAPDGKLVPDAARSWQAEDGRYVFHLDRMSTFSNGRPLIASDVVWSFERVLSPQSRSSRTWVLNRIRGAAAFTQGRTATISGMTAPDDSTVVIELEAPFAPFLQMLAMPAACIVPREIVEADPDGFASSPVGSGVWQLAEWQRGDFLRLEPNPHHSRGAAGVRKIVFRVIPEAFTRVAEFESGNLDLLKIPAAELDRFLGDKASAGRIQSRPELRVLYVGLNNTRGPLQDVRVRRALNMAVDTDRLIDVLTGGHATRAVGSVPPTLPGFAKRAAYAYDPPEARRLLAEAGYADGFEMEIWQRDSPDGNRIVEAVQGYLREVGVKVRIVKREWNAFKEAVSNGRVDAFFLDWWADYPNAENFLFPLFHSSNVGGGGNRVFFKNERVDAMIEHAQVIDSSRADSLYAEIDGIIYGQAPWIYLYFPTTFVAVSPRIENYVFPVLYLGEEWARVRKISK